jgi:hypothetical protein
MAVLGIIMMGAALMVAAGFISQFFERRARTRRTKRGR